MSNENFIVQSKPEEGNEITVETIKYILDYQDCDTTHEMAKHIMQLIKPLQDELRELSQRYSARVEGIEALNAQLKEAREEIERLKQLK